MAERTLAENVAQVKADFKAVRDAVPYVFDDNTPTSQYGERIHSEIQNLQYQADSAHTWGVEEGKEAQKLEWWGKYLNNGNEIYGYSVFGGYRWNDELFDPPYDINLKSSSNAFYYTYIQDLRGILQRNGVNLIFSESGNQHFNVFLSAQVVYLPYLKLPTTSSAYGWFANCSKLTEVDGYECTERHTFEYGSSSNNKTFYNCTDLIHIIFHGTIANSINLQWCTKLDLESLISLFKCLKELYEPDESFTKTITLSAESWALTETDEFKAILGMSGKSYCDFVCWSYQ